MTVRTASLEGCPLQAFEVKEYHLESPFFFSCPVFFWLERYKIAFRRRNSCIVIFLPWEPTTFIFRGYNPYIGGLKPSFFMVLGSKGRYWYTNSNYNHRKVAPRHPFILLVTLQVSQKPMKTGSPTCNTGTVQDWLLLGRGTREGLLSGAPIKQGSTKTMILTTQASKCS